MTETRKGMLLVISGPSGAGKGTLLHRLLQEDDSFTFSVSATTRGPRPGEVDGKHYHFMDQATFEQLIQEDAFVEYAQVHGNYYGTMKQEVYTRIERGENVLLDIDTQGAKSVMAKEPECVSVFILPPSFRELEARLIGRHTEEPEDVARRMRNAHGEVKELGRYDYVLVNDDLTRAYEHLKAITQAEKFRTNRYFPVLED